MACGQTGQASGLGSHRRLIMLPLCVLCIAMGTESKGIFFLASRYWLACEQRENLWRFLSLDAYYTHETSLYLTTVLLRLSRGGRDMITGKSQRWACTQPMPVAKMRRR
jgi:hypothetical protein